MELLPENPMTLAYVSHMLARMGEGEAAELVLGERRYASIAGSRLGGVTRYSCNTRIVL